MKTKKILIPTSKYVEKGLRDIYGDIPPILVPVDDDKTLIENISMNNQDSKIFLLSNEGKEKINQIILEKGLKNVVNIEISKTDSIRDTILSINEILEGEILLLFGDTTTRSFKFDKYFNTDSISYSEIVVNKTNKFRWTFFNDENSIEILNNKTLIDNEKLKIFNGIFHFKDFKNFMKILRANKTFYQSIIQYYNKNEMQLIHELDWLDFGDIKNFKKNKLIEPRSFNSITVSSDKKTLTKKSEIKDKFINEINWYVYLPKELNGYIPKINHYSVNFDDPFITMEFINDPTLSELFMNSNLGFSFWCKLINEILLLKEKFAKFKIKNNDINNDLIEMYYFKTVERLQSLSDDLKDIFFKEELLINGKTLWGIDFILSKLNTLVEKHLLNIEEFSIIHGDLFFANMLLTKENGIHKILLIDPRGSFSSNRSQLSFEEKILYGDERYDWAKLSHSVRGKYDVIINDLFTIKIQGQNIDYSFTNNNNTKMIEEILRFIINKNTNFVYDKEILFIESLLFLSMAYLHEDYPERQKMMLVTGIELFNEFYRRNENDNKK